MNDNEIVEAIASLWISLGGDRDGFIYCQGKIADKIKEKLSDEDKN